MESIAAESLDVRGIRRGMERIPVFRTGEIDKTSKAALGKSRRLMSLCIKATVPFISLTQFLTSTHTLDADRNKNLEIHLNAGERSTQFLLPEVDRMPRSQPTLNADAEKRAYSDQLAASTEDEIRLLGGSTYEALPLFEGLYKLLIEFSRKDDPQAVSIIKPETRHSSMLRKVGFSMVR